MIYCVVPEVLADELYDQLVKYYEADSNVEVIIDRRHADRRRTRITSDPGDVEAPEPGAANSASEDGSADRLPSHDHRRIVRDRRRARITGDFPSVDPSSEAEQ